ncbi:MAG TPA: hypothetical protein VFF69_04940 [Phycisphaerales bacterium]|nr:hypothetical protein [Phycisphaerales bacterium]
MLAAVSPYHMTTREPPAMAALLLAERALTFMPAPRGTREAIEQAAAESPEYLRFMETWAWSMPLWERGAIGSALNGDNAFNDMHTAWRQLMDDERYAPLRPLARTGLFETQREYLDAVSRDLLKGGPDPGISLPLAAGIDRFAARRGLVVMRSAPASVSQKAESLLGRRVFAVALPILVQASAEKLIEVRELLADELEELAAAIGEVARVVGAGDEVRDDPELVARVEQASRAYAHAFECERDTILSPATRDDLHVIERMTSLTAVTLPVDAVLRSGVSAMRSLASGGRTTRSVQPAVETLPVLADTLGGRRVLSLVVKPLGVRRS